MPSSEKSATAFLNVDIDIRSQSSLDELLEAIEPFALILHRTAEDASFELKEVYESLDETILAAVELVASFSPQARKIWDDCKFRKLNIGIQAGNAPHSASFSVSNEALSSSASVSYEVEITVYAPV
jgi:hypothetical protein